MRAESHARVAAVAAVAASALAAFAFRRYLRRERRGTRRKIFLTGASGYLGQHLLHYLYSAAPEELEVHAAFGGLEGFESEFAGYAASFHRVDLADEAAVRRLVLSLQPDAVIHCAAISSPAACEKDVARSGAVNTPRALLDALPADTLFVFLSTDQVYDGASRHNDDGDAAARPTPINAYGREKLAFEDALHEALPRTAISLRSSLILGPTTPGRCRKQSFLQFVSGRIASATPTQFISDEFRSVVWVGDLCRIIVWAITGGAAEAPGRYNMGGPARLTRVDVARAVAAGAPGRGALSLAEERSLVEAVPRDSFPPSGVASPADISMTSARIAAAARVPLTPLRTMVDAAMLAEPFTLILQLGASNDADGRVDSDALARSACTARLANALGPNARVLASGGSDYPRFSFNPTPTPHWELVERALLAAGVAETALLRPGLDALHTVDEALLARALVRQLAVSRPPSSVVRELVVVTSDYHAPRARHLFGVAFSAAARCELPIRVEEVPGTLQGPALATRQTHEAASLETLRTAPHGEWAAFLGMHSEARALNAQARAP